MPVPESMLSLSVYLALTLALVAGIGLTRTFKVVKEYERGVKFTDT